MTYVLSFTCGQTHAPAAGAVGAAEVSVRVMELSLLMSCLTADGPECSIWRSPTRVSCLCSGSCGSECEDEYCAFFCVYWAISAQTGGRQHVRAAGAVGAVEVSVVPMLCSCKWLIIAADMHGRPTQCARGRA